MDFIQYIPELATLVISIIFGALMFQVIRYVPSRWEFDMHLKQDDERYASMQRSLDRLTVDIRDSRLDIIREIKGTVVDANKREHS